MSTVIPPWKNINDAAKQTWFFFQARSKTRTICRTRAVLNKASADSHNAGLMQYVNVLSEFLHERYPIPMILLACDMSESLSMTGKKWLENNRARSPKKIPSEFAGPQCSLADYEGPWDVPVRLMRSYFEFKATVMNDMCELMGFANKRGV